MNRFDFEQCIMSVWTITEDLQLVYENAIEKKLSADELANAILALKTVYQMKFDKLWDGFESLTPVLCAGTDVIESRKLNSQGALNANLTNFSIESVYGVDDYKHYRENI